MRSRREFLGNTVNAGLVAGAALGARRSDGATADNAETARPNILWLVAEDIGPELGCYGDAYADTPQLDAFAGRGMLYENCWSTAPVCAPARTTIISGLYPPSTGAEHMRSLTHLPSDFKMFPQYLREAGYYCTNNPKEDYNLEKPGTVWDESSRKAHWKNRGAGQPFFAVFNNSVTHESNMRTRPHTAVHDPAKAPIPAYHPDTPEVRQDWAQYYDNITTLDTWFGEQLATLEAAGLAEDTIVFFYGDHGSGMPRSKRWPYESGLGVACITYFPPKFQHLAPKAYRPAAMTDRLIGFIDLAPTVLSLADVKPPEHFQGHAFCGAHEAMEQPFLFGFRGRMDERYDLVRTVRDKRYHYIRNYMPHKIYGQFLDYMFKTPTTRIWRELYDQGKLNPAQARFWETKPAEELYDLQSDPDEVNNLVDSSEHAKILDALRHAQQAWTMRIRDVGFLPEDEIHTRSVESSPYEMGHDDSQYPLDRILAMADTASSLKDDAGPALLAGMADDDSAVRYWAAMGFLMRGVQGLDEGREALRDAAKDDASPSVRIVAAETLGRFGGERDLKLALKTLQALLKSGENHYYVALQAMNAIDTLGDKAGSLKADLAALPSAEDWPSPRGSAYTQRMGARILSKLR